MFLTSPQLSLLQRDLRRGPSAVFSRSATWRLPVDAPVDRLRHRWLGLLHEFPVARRVRRKDRGWQFEPTPYPPDLYVERHLVDSDSDAAHRRLAVERRRPLDPVSGPLARASLLRYDSGCAYLVVSVHELCVEWCSPLRLARELSDAVSLPQPLVDSRRLARSRRDRMSTKER